MTPERRRRINRLKKAILAIIIVAIIAPCVGCAWLSYHLSRAKQETAAAVATAEELSLQLEAMESVMEAVDFVLTTVETTEEVITLEETDVSVDVETDEDVKTVYLTFDDGPSSNTSQILDILAEYDVKATFFVVGSTKSTAKALYQRIIDEGHTLGIHSYSHKYDEIYASEDAFFEDFYKLSDYLYDVTGVRPTVCRLPGGSSNTVSSLDMAQIVSDLKKQGISCFDWNISGKDADGTSLSATTIANNVLNGVDMFHTSMVLLHDGADKDATVEALRLVLEDLTAREDVRIAAIDEHTPEILHITYE